MRRRFLKFLATFTFRRAVWIMPLLIGLTAWSIWLADGMSFDMSLTAFLPARQQANSSLGEITSDYRKLEPVMVVIRTRAGGGNSAELIAVASEMANLLNDRRFFSNPVYKIDEVWRHYYESLSDIRLIMLLTSSDWSELQRLMSSRISLDRLRRELAWRTSLVKPPKMATGGGEDPLGALAAIRNRLANSRGPTRLETVNGYLLSADRSAIAVLLYPVCSPENGRDAYRALRFLENCRKSLFEKHQAWRNAFDIEFGGGMVTTGRELRRMENDGQLILMLAAPLVLLLILLVYRKAEAIVFILLPPLVGLAWTFALARLVFGGISVVTAVFLLLIMAIGIQYSVHLYHRFVMELYRLQHYYRALTISYLETGRGILASAVVVAFLFFLLFATSLSDIEGWRGVAHARGFGELGIVAGLGILCNLAACLLSLPLLAAIKHWMARGRIKPVALYRFHLDRLYEPALTNPRTTLLVMLMLTVFLSYPTNSLDFSPVTVTPFLNSPEPATETPGKGDFPRPGRPLIAIVRGTTRQEALERNDQLYENLLGLGDQFNILSVDSLRTVLPSLHSQKASLDRLQALDLAPFQRQIAEACKATGFKPTYFDPFLKAIKDFKAAAARQPRTIDYTIEGEEALEEALSATVPRYMTRQSDGGYAVATVIYPHEAGFPNTRLGQLAVALRKNGLTDLELVGDPLIERDFGRLVKFNLAVMLLLSVVVIYLALVLHFHSRRLAWLTFLPVLVELVWLAGMMELAGIEIHFFTVLVMPLVLSLAMDNALQVTQYFHDRRPCSVRHVMLTVGRVVVLSCGITALLYGAFSLALYPGARDFGIVVLFAAGIVLIGTVMLLPALLILFGRGQQLTEALVVEGEGEGEEN